MAGLKCQSDFSGFFFKHEENSLAIFLPFNDEIELPEWTGLWVELNFLNHEQQKTKQKMGWN